MGTMGSDPPQGSSPRTRGALGRPLDLKSPEGIIPAYAGSTAALHVQPGQRRDHPRVRGEHRESLPHLERYWGSSPRTRGALKDDPSTRQAVRIIPAYAGSTLKGDSANQAGEDHPRVRGEHSPPSSLNSPRWGSSPRTRGALRRAHVLPYLRGIIPAYAGSTKSVVFSG